MKLTKAQALKKIEELKKFVEGEGAEVLVPDSINLEEWVWDGDGLSIVNEKQNQWLCLYKEGYEVNTGVCSADFIDCKLIPLWDDELEIWHTYFLSDDIADDIEVHADDDDWIGDLTSYAKYLWDGNFIRWGYENEWYQLPEINYWIDYDEIQKVVRVNE